MFLTEALSGVVSIERTSRKEVDALIGALINLEIASHLIADKAVAARLINQIYAKK